jgi:hypothetical protein
VKNLGLLNFGLVLMGAAMMEGAAHAESQAFQSFASNPLDFSAPVVNSRTNVTEAPLGAILYDAYAGAFFGLTAASGTSSGSWVQLGGAAGGATNNNFTGSMPNGASWTNGTSTYGTGSNSGGNTLTTLVSNGIAVTAAASNVPGITFTPASSSSIYSITASFRMSNTSQNADLAARLTDGTTPFAYSLCSVDSGFQVSCPMTVQGNYAASSTSPVTIKIEFATGGGTAQIYGRSSAPIVPSITWNVVQIK